MRLVKRVLVSLTSHSNLQVTLDPIEDARDHCRSGVDKDGFEIRFINDDSCQFL